MARRTFSRLLYIHGSVLKSQTDHITTKTTQGLKLWNILVAQTLALIIRGEIGSVQLDWGFRTWWTEHGWEISIRSACAMLR